AIHYSDKNHSHSSFNTSSLNTITCLPPSLKLPPSQRAHTQKRRRKHIKTLTVPSQRVALIEKVLLLKKHRSSGIRDRSDHALYSILIYFGFHRHPTSGRNCNIHA
ncbi:hypothetical protein M422DRAFT_783037, partial [Sphaerobolus stellatus SS14]